MMDPFIIGETKKLVNLEPPLSSHKELFYQCL